MTLRPKLIIEPLSKQHSRQGFACGVAALDTYLHRQSGQDIRRGICRVYVAIEATFDGMHEVPVLGYYTLSGLSVSCHHFPPELARKLPKHPIPAALLGRLAVARTHHGLGIGRLLLGDAIQRVRNLSTQLGLYAIVVDALDDAASRFYRKIGFLPMEQSHLRLFLRLAR